jgi:hypothetical protein
MTGPTGMTGPQGEFSRNVLNNMLKAHVKLAQSTFGATTSSQRLDIS